MRQFLCYTRTILISLVLPLFELVRQSMETTELLLVLSISGPFRTCTPQRGSLHIAQGKRSGTMGMYVVWNDALKEQKHNSFITWALPFRFAPVTVGSARGFTRSTARSELICYDYAVLPTRKAEEP